MNFLLNAELNSFSRHNANAAVLCASGATIHFLTLVKMTSCASTLCKHSLWKNPKAASHFLKPYFNEFTCLCAAI